MLYDSESGHFHDYSQDQVADLCRHLAQLDRVVGFNLIRFDYRVLAGLSDFDFYSLPTLDILVKIHDILGYRLSLDHLAKNTLGAQKSADGLMALTWWQQGEMDKIIEYCTQMCGSPGPVPVRPGQPVSDIQKQGRPTGPGPGVLVGSIIADGGIHTGWHPFIRRPFV